jgi:hypothetical protein
MFRGCVAWTGVVSSHRDHNLMPQGGSMAQLFNKKAMNSHSKIDPKRRARIPPKLFIKFFCQNFGTQTFCF